MGIFMSIQHPDSVGKVRKILLFEAVFHDSASACTKLTLRLISLVFQQAVALSAVFFTKSPDLANKVLTDVLSSAIPVLSTICTLSISLQCCSNDKNNAADEDTFLMVVTCPSIPDKA